MKLLLISNFLLLLNSVFFLLGDPPASEFYVPMFRNILSHLHRRYKQQEEPEKSYSTHHLLIDSSNIIHIFNMTRFVLIFSFTPVFVGELDLIFFSVLALSV